MTSGAPPDGPWLVRSFPTADEPGIWLLHGRIVSSREADGTFITFSFVGTSQNLCLKVTA